MAASEESMRLFRIRKNTMEMLKDRGYLVVDEELSMDFKQFKDKFGDSVKRDDLAICKPKKDNPSDQVSSLNSQFRFQLVVCIYIYFDSCEHEQIFVFFPNDEKVGVPHVRKAVERMTQESVFRAILVVQQNPTPAAKAAIQDQAISHKYHLEVFQVGCRG